MGLLGERWDVRKKSSRGEMEVVLKVQVVLMSIYVNDFATQTANSWLSRPILCVRSLPAPENLNQIDSLIVDETGSAVPTTAACAWAKATKPLDSHI